MSDRSSGTCLRTRWLTATTLLFAALATGCGGTSDAEGCRGLVTADQVGDVTGQRVTLDELDEQEVDRKLTDPDQDMRGEELVSDDSADVDICDFSSADGQDVSEVVVVSPGDTGWPAESPDAYAQDYDSQQVDVDGEPAVYFSDEVPPTRADLWVSIGDDLDVVVTGDELTPQQSLEIARAAVQSQR